MATKTVLTEQGTSKTIQAGGMNVHYHDVGNGEPLIMLPSVGPGATAWITFHKNLPELSEHFRCIAMDLPGVAKTGPVIYNEPVHNLQARTALALMDALGIQKAHILGNSQGGQSAMVFAAHYPERTNKLVFGACHIVTGSDRYLMANRPSEAMRASRELGQNPDPTREDIRRVLRLFIDNQALVTNELVEYSYNIMHSRPDLAEARRKSTSTYYDHGPAIVNIKAPTLIIWGRYDRMCAFEVGVNALNHIHNSRMVLLNDCGHWVPFEKPEAYNAHVLNFLRGNWA